MQPVLPRQPQVSISISSRAKSFANWMTCKRSIALMCNIAIIVCRLQAVWFISSWQYLLTALLLASLVGADTEMMFDWLRACETSHTVKLEC